MKIAVTWEMCGFVDIAAPTIEDAMQIFEEQSDYIKLPTDGEYVDGSFVLSTYDVEEMQALTENVD